MIKITLLLFIICSLCSCSFSKLAELIAWCFFWNVYMLVLIYIITWVAYPIAIKPWYTKQETIGNIWTRTKRKCVQKWWWRSIFRIRYSSTATPEWLNSSEKMRRNSNLTLRAANQTVWWRNLKIQLCKYQHCLTHYLNINVSFCFETPNSTSLFS